MEQPPEAASIPPETVMAEARQATAAPAMALMIVGAASALTFIVGLVANQQMMNAVAGWMPDGASQQIRDTGKSASLNLISSGAGLLLSVLVFAGGFQQRKLTSYGLCIVGALAACVPCIGSCCCLGTPFGIWAFVVLLKPDVKAGFDALRARL